MSDLLGALDQPHVQLLLRIVLGGLLLLAGVTKLADRAAFREAVAQYDVLPRALERPFAFTMPLVETTLGALLLLGFGTTIAAAIATPLFLSFGIAIGVNLARGRHFDCHCFGAVQSDSIGWPALIRSLVLVVAALTVAAGASRFGALEAALFGGSDLPSAAEVVPVLLVAFVIFDVLILLPETVNVQFAFDRRQATAITGHAHSDHAREGSAG